MWELKVTKVHMNACQKNVEVACFVKHLLKNIFWAGIWISLFYLETCAKFCLALRSAKSNVQILKTTRSNYKHHVITCKHCTMDQQNMYLNWCVDYEISSDHLNILDFRIHHLETLLLSNNGVLKQKKSLLWTRVQTNRMETKIQEICCSLELSFWCE